MLHSKNLNVLNSRDLHLPHPLIVLLTVVGFINPNEFKIIKLNLLLNRPRRSLRLPNPLGRSRLPMLVRLMPCPLHAFKLVFGHGCRVYRHSGDCLSALDIVRRHVFGAGQKLEYQNFLRRHQINNTCKLRLTTTVGKLVLNIVDAEFSGLMPNWVELVRPDLGFQGRVDQAS